MKIFTLGNVLIYLAIILAFVVGNYGNWQLAIVAFFSPYLVCIIVFMIEDLPYNKTPKEIK